MRPSNNIQAHARLSIGLILALAGLMGGTILMFLPARCALAQTVGPSWSYTSNLNHARSQHKATLLPNGEVLVVGGYGDTNFLNKAELYDPITGMWNYTGNLKPERVSATAILLQTGKVLVAGGYSDESAELYDPATGTWSSTGNLNEARGKPSATLLPNGKVLVAGGSVTGPGFSGASTRSAELYDPASGTWSKTGDLNDARQGHTATLLPNGKVLVAAGSYCIGDSCGGLNSAELYDPATGTWSLTGNLNTTRNYYSDGPTATLLPNGKVLVAGGFDIPDGSLRRDITNSAELYDPATGIWSSTGNLNVARDGHSATLLPNGKVLVAGGYGYGSNPHLNSAELYDPATGTWSITASLNTGRLFHTATLLLNGKVLVVGGSAGEVNDEHTLNTAELYDPGATPTSTPTPTPTPSPTPTPTATPTAIPTPTPTPTPAVAPSWSYSGSLNTARAEHTATLLPNGKVLVAGGQSSNNVDLNSAELYDPATETWSRTGNLNRARELHTATLLPNGKILVAGGGNGCFLGCLSLNTAELYDPATGAWSSTGNLSTARVGHTATLLYNGKVLVTGGDSTGNSAELYDPAPGTWSSTGNLTTARDTHTATLLPNGKVLVAGGCNGGAGVAHCIVLNSAELYNPATGTWSTTGNLNAGRVGHTATLLFNGKVLVAGDFDIDGSTSNSAELYDPASGTWSSTGSLNIGGYLQTSTVLPSGRVLVAGGELCEVFGDLCQIITDGAELYDPATGTWSTAPNLNMARVEHTATLLPNGRVLVAGGSGDNTAELYDPGANQIDDAQFFVRQHYLDFLNREPDADGLVYWTDRITQCGTDARCIHERRIAVSDAFFFEPEFQLTGSYVLRMYRTAYGNNQPIPNPDSGDPSAPFYPGPNFHLKFPSYGKFNQDRALLDPTSSTALTQSQLALANAFVGRPEFLAKYSAGLSGPDFVDAVLATIRNDIGAELASQRETLIGHFNTGGRGLVMFHLANDYWNGCGSGVPVPCVPTNVGPAVDNRPLIDAEYNLVFVATEYFGYLRRDGDANGLNFWLVEQVNRFPLRNIDIQHAMVCSFVTSIEYQRRFGSVVTRSNADCGQ